MKILAFDPGRTTGACLIRTNDRGFEVVRAVEIPWENRFRETMALVSSMYQFPTDKPQPQIAIVIENFRLRRGRAVEQSGSDFPSSQVLGAIGAWAYMWDLTDKIALQEPSVIGRVQILPEHEVHVKGSEHKKDAYKHARYYFITRTHET